MGPCGLVSPLPFSSFSSLSPFVPVGSVAGFSFGMLSIGLFFLPSRPLWVSLGWYNKPLAGLWGCLSGTFFPFSFAPCGSVYTQGLVVFVLWVFFFSG